MIKSQPHRYLVFPAVLVLVVFALLYVQFSGKQSIAHPFGDYVISGAAPSAPGADGVSNFSLSGFGLTFPFHSTSTLRVRTADKTERPLRAKSYSLTETRLVMEFQHGLRLQFNLDRQGGLTAEVLLSPELEGSLMVAIPFQAPSLVPEAASFGLPAVEIVSGRRRSFLLLNGAGDRIDTEKGVLEVHSLASGFLPIQFLLAPSETLSATEFWLGNAPDVEGTLQRARTLAFNSWRTTRRRGASGWVGDGLAARLDNDIFNALFAEAELRDALRPVWLEWAPSVGVWSTASNLDTAVITGDIVRAWEGRKQQLEEVLPGVISGDWTDWVTDPALIRDYYLLTDPDVFGALWNKWRDRRPKSAEEAVARLEALYLLSPFTNKAEIPSLKEEAKRQASGWITRAAAGVWLKNQKGLLDLSLSLRLGARLLRSERPPVGTAWDRLGAILVGNVLDKAEGSLMPRALIPTENGWRKEGTFGLEVAYRALFDPKTWPQLVRLPSLPGGLALHRPSTSISIDNRTITIRAVQPLGMPQHVVIQGVPSFSHVVLHGLRWTGDPGFQNLTDGWYYDGATKTFYAKISNWTEVAVLVIHFTSDF